MIESLDREYDGFFEEPSYLKRWERLKEIYGTSPASFRVLFVVETLAMLDKWAEPTPELLKKVWDHVRAGGVLGIRDENLRPLFLPVWSLEIAKAEVQVFKLAVEHSLKAKYPFVTLRCYSSALIHAWWALETMTNDFAGIIAEQRGGKLSAEERLFLSERRLRLDKTGTPVEEGYYQYLDERIQFIHRLLTGESLDRGGQLWQRLMELKNTRDGFVHRLGKPGGVQDLMSQDTVVTEGMAAVRMLMAQLFSKTPEFSGRFGYTFLSFWSCGCEEPFLWDGREGKRFYLGLAAPKIDAVLDLRAPELGNL